MAMWINLGTVHVDSEGMWDHIEVEVSIPVHRPIRGQFTDVEDIRAQMAEVWDVPIRMYVQSDGTIRGEHRDATTGRTIWIAHE